MFTSLISRDNEEVEVRKRSLQRDDGGVRGAEVTNGTAHGQEQRRRAYVDKRKERELLFRTENPGYWVLILLPLAIYLADQKFLQQSLPAVSIISYNSALLFFLHLYAGPKEMKECLGQLQGFNFGLALTTLCYGFVTYREDGDWNTMYEYLLWAGLNFSFPYVFVNVVLHYPQSFSFGEAVIVCSVFVYNYWTTFHNIIQSKFSDLQNATDPIMLTVVQELAFLATILIARFVLVFKRWWQVFLLQEVYTMCTKAAFANFMGKLQSPSEDLQFLVMWIIRYLLFDKRHIAFIILWLMFLAVTVVFVLNTVGQQTTTVHRKFFHLLMCMVYFPVVLNDLNFIFFCSTLVCYAFVVIEAVRVLKFELLGYQIGAAIDGCIENFRDDRDIGPLLLTPIYLLAGCSAPIWLTGLYLENVTTTNDDRTAEELAAAITGILSVGVGDTVASVVGSMFGKRRWPGSKKTMEGTLSSILAQLATVGVLCWSGLLPYNTVTLTALCISCVVNACVEASTDQIDNLVVPLVAFNTVQIVIYFADYFAY